LNIYLVLSFCFLNTFRNIGCQPELVEGGFLLMHRVRQAHPDTQIKLNSFFIDNAMVSVPRTILAFLFFPFS
jgi:hypothetical protein